MDWAKSREVRLPECGSSARSEAPTCDNLVPQGLFGFSPIGTRPIWKRSRTRTIDGTF